jgi:hypothetical protein
MQQISSVAASSCGLRFKWVEQRRANALLRDQSTCDGLMASFSAPTGAGSAAPMALLQRTPQRVTATLSWELHRRLLQRADREGRSLSNLVCFLLETTA